MAWASHCEYRLKLIENPAIGQLEVHSLGGTRRIDLRA